MVATSGSMAPGQACTQEEAKQRLKRWDGGRVCSSPTQARHQEGGHVTAVELHTVVPTVSHGLRCSMESGG